MCSQYNKDEDIPYVVVDDYNSAKSSELSSFRREEGGLLLSILPKTTAIHLSGKRASGMP